MKDRKLFTICLLLLASGFIFVRFGGERFLRERKPSRAEQHLTKKTAVTLTGQVYKIEQTSDYQILYLRNNSINYIENQREKSLKESRLIIYDKEHSKVKPGNTALVKGEVSFFDTARNPGNFDSKFYYRKQNIHVRIFSTQIKIYGDTWKVREWLHNVKSRLTTIYAKAAGEENGGILGAMLLGDRGNMDSDIKELYQKNGIAHVIAISGLHLSFVGAGVYQFLRKRTGSYLIGGIAGMLFLCTYILMIGVTVSAFRALVMFLMRVGADMSGRTYDGLTALSAAAVLVIVWRPLSYFDGGFQLSFGTVLGIFALVPKQTERKDRVGKIKEAVMAGFLINVAILPILLYHYFEFPLYSLLINIVVIPLMSVLLMLGLWGGILFMVCEPLGNLMIWGCTEILELYESLCRLAGRLPFCRVVTGRPDMWQIVVYYLAVAMICIVLKRKRNFFVLLYGAAVIMLMGGSKVWNGNSMEITMLDVGQGDSIFVRGAGGETFLVDGGSSDVKMAGRYRIEPFLKCRGVGMLDYVLVSHGDADHINGIEEILNRMELGVKIGCLVLPKENVWDESLKELAILAKEKDVPVVVIGSGEKIQGRKGLTITCRQPGEDYEGEIGNAASMVLELSYAQFDMLFTGDVEGEGERALERNIKKEYDILKTAHHGSKNSTTEQFLLTCQVRYALISAGRDNRYGHPHEETLKRLQEDGSEVISTQDTGAITIRTNGEEMTVETYLEKRKIL